MSTTADVMRIRGTDTLATALAAGRTVAEAARLAGLSERTAYRRLSDRRVRRRVEEARAALFESTLGQLAEAQQAAVATLVRNMEVAPPAVQVRAALAILEQAARRREGEDLAGQVAKLTAVVLGDGDEGADRAAA